MWELRRAKWCTDSFFFLKILRVFAVSIVPAVLHTYVLSSSPLKPRKIIFFVCLFARWLTLSEMVGNHCHCSQTERHCFCRKPLTDGSKEKGNAYARQVILSTRPCCLVMSYLTNRMGTPLRLSLVHCLPLRQWVARGPALCWATTVPHP
jgi:hypothetical protein